MESKKDELKDYLKKNNQDYYELVEEDHLNSIYEVFIKKNESAIDERFFSNATYLNYLGGYFGEFDIQKAKYYYQMGVELENTISMSRLGTLFYIENDDTNALLYWEMAADKGQLSAITNLIVFYQKDNNLEKIYKYAKIGSDLNDIPSIILLAKIYEGKGEENKMIFYFQKAVDLNNSNAMFLLGHYYDLKNDEINMLKYMNMGVEFKNIYSMIYLMDFYEKKKNTNEMFRYWKILFEINKIDALKNFIKYFKKSDINPFLNDIKLFIEEINEMINTKPDIEPELLKIIVQFSILLDDDEQFLQLYEKFKTHEVFQTFHTFYTIRKTYSKRDDCCICSFEKDLIPFDCLWHHYCTTCYFHIKECPQCKVKKSETYLNMFSYENDTNNNFIIDFHN